jgi:hypothetical protein
MFDVAIENLRKTADATIRMQQELFTKLVSLWPAQPALPAAFGEPLAFQKRWTEFVGDQIKKQRESLESQFSAGLKSIEEAFRVGEAKDPEELRARTVELWRKAFDFQRQVCEAQLRDLQAVVTKWSEPAAKGGA